MRKLKRLRPAPTDPELDDPTYDVPIAHRDFFPVEAHHWSRDCCCMIAAWHDLPLSRHLPGSGAGGRDRFEINNGEVMTLVRNLNDLKDDEAEALAGDIEFAFLYPSDD